MKVYEPSPEEIAQRCREIRERHLKEKLSQDPKRHNGFRDRLTVRILERRRVFVMEVE